MSRGYARSDGGPVDVVVATERGGEVAIRAALAGLGPETEVETLLDRAPLHWFRVRCAVPATAPFDADALRALLARAGVRVRYVASSHASSMDLAPPFDRAGAAPVRPVDWKARRRRRGPPVAIPSSDGHWFLRDQGGVRVDRRLCGTGAGTRLAVIDDDIGDFEHLDVDRVTLVGVSRAPAVTGHMALMIGWAVGAHRPDGTDFVGVAPDTSVRVYVIPKPEVDIVGLPCAIARAVFDGADVVVCATHVEGTTSPMLDDALDLAARLGRRGRGAIVVVPTGRETSSPRGSLHASLSLSLADPASDPRVYCVAPGGRRGGWFLWRKSAQGKLRPLANRGPAVRWTAPGDDMAYPFSSHDRLFHAESSGASAVAAGVVCLVLGCNPRLRAREVHGLLRGTADVLEPSDASDPALADPMDLLPAGRDRDGHDAKCGYGRLHASRACLGARDPVALALTAMGEDAAAARWVSGSLRPYSARLGRWAARRLLARPDLEHFVRVALRHLRLVVADECRAQAHTAGALSRTVTLLLRGLRESPGVRSTDASELDHALARLQREPRAVEEAILGLASRVLRREQPSSAEADARSNTVAIGFSRTALGA